ncbi:MAG: PucR family transcriptional regulator [Sporomusaceae bacterium]|nr:PucR family transcriptional regulator [Sporomusaceae bacterium]
MNIKDIIKTHSLSGARFIAGCEAPLLEITGVNILEATDISSWGRAGEVILTSFFALQNLNDQELDRFFEKLHHIGISAFIIKIDRLLPQIPQLIITLCDKHQIPLIQIGKDIKYESIILAILGPIINQNINLLNKYYEAHSELTRLALKMPSMSRILHEFKKMLARDVSLRNATKGTVVSTNPALDDVTVTGFRAVLTERYVHFPYERKDVVYNAFMPQLAGQQLCVHIPHLGYDDYELIIHELTEQIAAEDFMVLENGVKLLQMELLKKYVISQNLFQQKNNLISDLLNDRLYDEKAIDEALESLAINNYLYYQVVLIKLSPKNGNGLKDLMPQALRQIRLLFKAGFAETVFLEKLDRIVFIVNLDEKQPAIAAAAIEKLMNSPALKQLLKEFHYSASLSSKVARQDIPRANIEVLDAQKVLRVFHNGNTILPYEELGIYKLLLSMDSLGDLEKFIPPHIAAFRYKFPQLFETLKTFLDANQSYPITAEKLFLHPKTVRYRLQKINESLAIDFTNPEEILQIQVAARLFKLLDGRKNNG